MIPTKYSSPSRRETSREACIRAAMNTSGRYQPDGCWDAVAAPAPAGSKVLPVYKQVNRKFCRSGGKASY